MKRLISLLLCAAVVLSSVFAMAGCTKQNELKSDIVLITDGNDINDNGYNHSAWEGISEFADENALTCRYYQPVLDDGKLTTENIEKYVELSAENGAQYIVFPGEEFAVPVCDIAPLYPDLKFLLLDAIPHSQNDSVDRFYENVMSVKFDALQSGVLAGYLAVANGNTELGFFGEFNSESSANYGAGFIQGADLASKELGVPVTVDWADYDSPLLDYDYNFTITACYKKIADVEDKNFNVKVENGIGTGTYTDGSNVTITADPAPFGQEFDKWEVKSDTDGVKDSKVNISSKTKSTMNLLVEKCDCTITATYKDVEGVAYSVKTMSADGEEVVLDQTVAENGQCEISAPIAQKNMVFDHWESTVSDAVEDIYSKDTKLNEVTQDVTVTPVYKYSDTPTFNVTVAAGEGCGEGETTGSGSYVAGDKVNISAPAPAEGYMFYQWKNEDAYGNNTGIAMDNEYYWSTSFEMVDRYASICKTMFNHGASLVFNGGNSKADSAITAKNDYDYSLNVISAGENNKNAYITIVNDFRVATKNCLAEFKGGSVYAANCSNEGLYASFVSDDTDVQSNFDKVYSDLASDKIKLVRAEGGAGSEFCIAYAERKISNTLTLNGWFKDGSVITVG